jgi:low affinity Fe/Cu permease
VTTQERKKQHAEVHAKLPSRGFSHWFSRVASKIADFTGRPWAFLTALLIIVVWAVTGPIFGFSDTWQLVINTGTTIVTFLMVFLIQNTQNRDARALHLKLDELLRATPKARKEFMEAEEEDLDEIEREKAIVDQADPAPPKERAHGHTIREGRSGNGKSKT